MLYFTSDWHISETRLGIEGGLDLFHRPFKSVEENNQFLLDRILETPFKEGDIFYNLGDVTSNYDERTDAFVRAIREKFPFLRLVLIRGNYDDKFPQVEKLFDSVYDDLWIKVGDYDVYLNHYPSKFLKEQIKDTDMGLYGHIHSLGKVKERNLNVGVDAWWGNPVSEEKILFTFNAMLNHYDNDVYCK